MNLKTGSEPGRPLPRRAFLVRKVVGRVHEPDVRERLREVAEQPLLVRVVLLGEQAEVVADSEQPLEERARLVPAAEGGEAVDEPERARQEHALAGREAVDLARVLLAVALDEAVARQVALDALDRADDARVVDRQEADERDEQGARVERLRAVRLHERVQLDVEALAAYLVV